MAIIHGVESTGKIIPLLLDSTGKVILSGTVSVSGTITVQQTAPANLLTGNHGYINAGWRKEGLSLNYSRRISERFQLVSTGAPVTLAQSTAVPVNKIHIYNSIVLFHTNGAPLYAVLYAYNSALAVNNEIAQSNGLGTNATLSAPNSIVLASGDYITAVIGALPVGLVMVSALFGYELDINL